jgi:aerobic-type carbon monoxide dehydrogenase small subunit (CoxS/CutS family)
VSRRLNATVERGPQVEIVVDGAPVPAYEGESVAAALLAAGRPSRMYCGIGLCFACVVPVDGRRVRTCQTPVRDGMRVGGES